MSLPSLPDVPRERRRTATFVAVGVLGVVCLLALVLGLKGLFAPASGSLLTSEPQPQPSAPSPTAAASTATPSATPSSASPTQQVPKDYVRFSSPSGNIHCAMSSLGARCDIADHTWRAPAKPASCTGRWGDGVEVDRERSGIVCSDRELRGGRTLAYGRLMVRGDFRCASRKDGVTCLDVRTHHAFAVARADYALR